MKRALKDIMDEHLGCFGNFNMEDQICKNFCVLRIRCAIEVDQNARLEFLEDLIYSDSSPFKIQ